MATVDQTQFLDKYRALQTPANAELVAVLKLWLLEGKSDDEIAVALGKNRSTATRKIGDICKYFGTDTNGKKEQRQQLVLLFRRYCSDFEVYSSLYPDWIQPNSITIKSENIVSKVVPITSITSTELALLGREYDRTALEKLSNQHKIILLKGADGIGKSTFARHFFGTHFTKLVRLEMGWKSVNVTPAEEKVAQILRKEFDEEPRNNFQTNLEILREKLSNKSRPIGILIDNLESSLGKDFQFRQELLGYHDLLRVLGDPDVCSFTLITSSRSLIPEGVKVYEHPLKGLDIEGWRQYFQDCKNFGTSESLIQMQIAYNGNPEIMDILHSKIQNPEFFNGDIEGYWNLHRNNLLADGAIKKLIMKDINWLQNENPKAYDLLRRIESNSICLDKHGFSLSDLDYLSKTSLVEIQERKYFLYPAIQEAIKLDLAENIINPNINMIDELNLNSNLALGSNKVTDLGDVNNQLETVQKLAADSNLLLHSFSNQINATEIKIIPSLFPTNLFVQSPLHNISTVNLNGKGVNQIVLGASTITTQLNFMTQENDFSNIIINSQSPFTPPNNHLI